MVKSIFLLSALIGTIGIGFSFGASRAMGSQDVVSREELLNLQAEVDPKKESDPAEVQSLPNSSLNYYPVWYCVARSVSSGFWYYWYSPNFSYARYRALNACTYYNGLTCVVECEPRYD
jgi:hypothetical protein